jgi:hypothetical protein
MSRDEPQLASFLRDLSLHARSRHYSGRDVKRLASFLTQHGLFPAEQAVWAARYARVYYFIVEADIQDAFADPHLIFLVEGRLVLADSELPARQVCRRSAQSGKLPEGSCLLLAWQVSDLPKLKGCLLISSSGQ